MQYDITVAVFGGARLNTPCVALITLIIMHEQLEWRIPSPSGFFDQFLRVY